MPIPKRNLNTGVEGELGKKGLVNLAEYIPNLKLKIVYATPNNIVNKQIYREPLCYLRKEAAEALRRVADELKKQGLALVIFDAYRPMSLQKYLFDAIPDKRYVRETSDHNQGIAVDVTLADANGVLPMPTNLDVFSEKSHHGYMKLPKNAIENREKLKRIMEKHGFEAFEFEWWHYTYAKLKNAEFLDILI